MMKIRYGDLTSNVTIFAALEGETVFKYKDSIYMKVDDPSGRMNAYNFTMHSLERLGCEYLVEPVYSELVIHVEDK